MKIREKIKKVSVLCLIFLLSINSFAAIVSDNDGSAFVTKAEFEALKNSFNSQIQSYNDSIDGKIDGAIAAYLAGIYISVLPEEYISKINNVAGGSLWALNKVENQGTSTMNPEIKVSGSRHLTINDGNNSIGGLLWYIRWNGVRLQVWHIQQKIGGDWQGNWQQHLGWDQPDYPNCDDWLNVFNGGYNDIAPGFNSTAKFINVKNNYTAVSEANEAGSGARWIYKEDLAGNKYLHLFDSKLFPYIKLNTWLHVYKDIYTNATTFKTAKTTAPASSIINVNDTQSLDTTSKLIDFGKFSNGTKYGDGSTNTGNYWDAIVSAVEENDGKDYRMRFFAKNTDNTIYANKIEDTLEFSSSETITKTIPKSYFNAIYYTGEGQNLGEYYQSAYTVKINKLKYKANNQKINQFINYPATSVFGKNVYNGQGIPFIHTQAEMSNLGIDIKFTTNDSAHKKVYFAISDGPFKDGVVDTASGYSLLYDNTNNDIDNVSHFALSTQDKMDYWINFYNVDDGYEAAIEFVSF